MTDILAANKIAWNNEVENGRDCCIPVGAAEIAAARRGEISLKLTQTKTVPPDWLGDVKGRKILALAAGGGQQGPLLAAAGAEVTVLDISPRQLDQDRKAMAQHGLSLTLVEGVMTDLSMFADASFDMVINPVSNCYIPDVNPVWRECFRVLKPGGFLLAGFDNPVCQIMDWDLQDKGIFQFRYRLPYADTEQLEQDRLDDLLVRGKSLQFGHLLQDQIGGQMRAGFLLCGLYEDNWGDPANRPIDNHLPAFIATRAVKLHQGFAIVQIPQVGMT